MPTAPASACSEPRCPHPAVDRGRCALHRRTTGGRGYGRLHQEARQSLRDSLPTPCAYGCGTLLTADGDWVAAHVVDGQPEHGWVASCRRCNEQAKHTRQEPTEGTPVSKSQAGPLPRMTRAANRTAWQNDSDLGFA